MTSGVFVRCILIGAGLQGGFGCANLGGQKRLLANGQDNGISNSQEQHQVHQELLRETVCS